MRSPNRIEMTTACYGQSTPLKDRNCPVNSLASENITGSFRHLLDDKVERINAMGDFVEPDTPLQEARLKQLIEIVRFTVNHTVFQELADINEDEDPLDSGRDLAGFPGLDSYLGELPLQMPKIHENKKESPAHRQFDHIINHASEKNRVDPDLIRAVIKAESDYDPSSTSSRGAMGLMQLMPETARELGVLNAYDPYENIMAGTRYLKLLLERYDGNIPLTLAAYNWGMGNVERRPGGIPTETRTYIARVTQFYRDPKS